MKISFENPDKINGLLTLVVEEEDYKNDVEKTLKDYRKKANVPGFRPGQAPMGMIKRQFGASVKMEAINKLVGQQIYKYVQDNNIQMLGEPLTSEKQEPVDIVVPIDKTADFIGFINELENESGMQMVSFGHAGDGNVHLCVVRGNRDEEVWIRELEENMDKAYGKAYQLGGVTSGEHGIGITKRRYFLRETPKENLAVMNSIKNALDPLHILNDKKSYITGEYNEEFI